MNVEHFNHLKKWFLKYIEDISPNNGRLKSLIQLKTVHSLNVAENSRALAEDLKLSQFDILTSEALGLFHDIGRFSQIIEFQTFSDPDSINHGEHGYKIIKQFDILSTLPAIDQKRILDGTHYHNSRKIPKHVSSDSLYFLKLVRDTDKLDIYRVISDSIKNNEFKEYPEITLDIDINGSLNPLALAQVQSKQTVSYKNVKSLVDFGLTQLSWIYDINYKFTFQQILKREIFEEITKLLPEEKEVNEVVQSVKSFIETKLKTTLK